MGYTGDQKRLYQLAWMQRRRQDWIDSQGGICAKCGTNSDLQVDHIDPKTKSMEPALIWSRKADIREAELAKCQVLCKPCHEAKTLAEMYIAPHGTPQMYRKGCRCDECRTVQVARVREWRERKKQNNNPR